MKRYWILILALVVTVDSFGSFGQEVKEEGSTITITVTNIKSKKGQILVALYDSPETHMKTRFDQLAFGPLTGDEVVVKFERVPKGAYSISLFHDENSNMDLDRSALGWPKEPYGFSNDAVAKFGPAAFEDCQFNVSGKDVSMKIKLQ